MKLDRVKTLDQIIERVIPEVHQLVLSRIWIATYHGMDDAEWRSKVLPTLVKWISVVMLAFQVLLRSADEVISKLNPGDISKELNIAAATVFVRGAEAYLPILDELPSLGVNSLVVEDIRRAHEQTPPEIPMATALPTLPVDIDPQSKKMSSEINFARTYSLFMQLKFRLADRVISTGDVALIARELRCMIGFMTHGMTQRYRQLLDDLSSKGIDDLSLFKCKPTEHSEQLSSNP